MNTKLPVHWAPSVYIIVPGWIFAESAGAQVGAELAGAGMATINAADMTVTVAAANDAAR